MSRSRFNHASNFDRNFNRMRTLFWIMFGFAITAILAIWVTIGFGLYTLVTDPESVGTIAAEVIRPVADVIRGE